jgi:hypothetical protein
MKVQLYCNPSTSEVAGEHATLHEAIDATRSVVVAGAILICDGLILATAVAGRGWLLEQAGIDRLVSEFADRWHPGSEHPPEGTALLFFDAGELSLGHFAVTGDPEHDFYWHWSGYALESKRGPEWWALAPKGPTVNNGNTRPGDTELELKLRRETS